MPAINVNPTRMELTRLKGRLKTARRGHKLLKDKRDELMKQFLDVVRENRALRAKVEEALMRAHGSFTVASALMSTEMLEQSLMYPKQSVDLTMSFQNIMSVNVPEYHFKTKNEDQGDIYPYGGGVPGYAAPGGGGKDLSAFGGGDRKDPPPGQRPGVCEDPADAGEHQIYHDEAGRERAGQYHSFDEGEGYATQGEHPGAA